jgi:hypothetical protein
MRLLLSMMMSADARAPFRYSIFPLRLGFYPQFGRLIFSLFTGIIMEYQKEFIRQYFFVFWRGLHNKAIG